MSTGIVDIMKRASVGTIQNSKPCDLRYGKVINTNPLKVQISPEFVLPSSILIIPQHLTDYSVEIVMDESKSGSTNNGETETILIKNSLKVGDKIVLIRQQGGSKYLIVDRIVG